LEYYTPSTGQWARGPDIPIGVHGMSPAFDAGTNRVYVAGGGVVAAGSQSNHLQILGITAASTAASTVASTEGIGSASTAASTEGIVELTPAPATIVVVVRNVFCAGEGLTCTCNGHVTYGSGDQLTDPRAVAGTVECTNAVFGDPIPNIYKECRCITETAETVDAGDAVTRTSDEAFDAFCSNELEECICNGSVTYGRGLTFSAPIDVQGSVGCTNAVFGDPVPDGYKECRCNAGMITRSVADVASPPATDSGHSRGKKKGKEGRNPGKAEALLSKTPRSQSGTFAGGLGGFAFVGAAVYAVMRPARMAKGYDKLAASEDASAVPETLRANNERATLLV
jgi:hypothetical protein